MPSLPLEAKRQAAKDIIDILAEISTLLVPFSSPSACRFPVPKSSCSEIQTLQKRVTDRKYA